MTFGKRQTAKPAFQPFKPDVRTASIDLVLGDENDELFI